MSSPTSFAPAESYRFIGASTLVFVALTSLLMRFMSTRYTEIAEILERHKIIGGGVYSFSYYVLGPMVSFIAVASILVGYIITACISSVSAVGNALPFTPYAQSTYLQLPMALGIIWFIAGLNIIGIKADAGYLWHLILAAFVMLNLVASGLVEFGNLGSWDRLHAALAKSRGRPEPGLVAGPLRYFRHPHLFLHPGLFRDRIGDPDRGSRPQLA